MFVVRCRSSISSHWIMRIFPTINHALTYVKVVKSGDYGTRDCIFLTRENADSIAIYTDKKMPEIWRFEK